MKKITIALSSDKNWFADLTEDQQKEYIEAHPHSKYAKAHRSQSDKEIAEIEDTMNAIQGGIHPSIATKTVDGKRVCADGSELPPHIKKLGLPPAWTNVVLNPDPEGSLLAIGKDSKGRSQYVYSEKYSKSQAEAKFRRIQAMTTDFEGMSRQNATNRASADSKTKDNADCMHLVMNLGLRPGSTKDTKAEKKAHGATTLKAEHVKPGPPMHLVFTGKDGVALDLPVKDKSVQIMLSERVKNVGPDGQLFHTSSESLSKYSHSLDSGHYKTKDFRTLLGTKTALKSIKEMEAPKTAKEYKERVRAVAERVSKSLGNTPTIALQSYIAPECFAEWKAGVQS